MKKRLFSLCLVLILLCTILPQTTLPAFAADTSGSCGDNLTWSFAEFTGTLTIKGSGAMTNWSSIYNVPWNSVKYDIKKVVLPSGLTSIGDYAFNNTEITSVSIPSTVKTIGVCAFYWCHSLTSAPIPEGVKTIKSGAFWDCNKLASATIPASVTSIEDGTFGACDSLSKITVASGNTAYVSSSGVLYTKDKTVLVQCPAGITGTFAVPSGVKTIMAESFGGCKISGISFPSSVTSIGSYAFQDCESLTKAVIPASFTSIPVGMYYGCGKIASVTIPSGVKTIGEKAFGYTALAAVTIPSSVTAIGDSAFSSTNLKTVTLPSSVTTLGSYVFSYCDQLTSATLPSGLKVINDDLFYTCESLKSITIPSGVTSIGYSAFAYCKSLTSITLPAGLKEIKSYAFDNCPALKHIVVPAGVTTIGTHAFGFWYHDGGYEVVEGFALIGEEGSAAETYAADNGVPFATKITVTSQPKSASVALGSSATFKVTATGKGLKYQWQYRKAGESSWTNWSGATKNSFTVTGSKTNNGCQYRCVISNAAYSVNSAAVTLTVTQAAAKPSITAHPKAATAKVGETVTFKVTASGSGLKYQWQYRKAGYTTWSNWSGMTSSSVSVKVSTTNHGCQYRCVVSNSAGSVNSGAALLIASDLRPYILTQPASASAAKGKTVTFKITAAGVGTKYQWQFRKAGTSTWYNWDGKTSASLPVTASATNNGCQYRCVVSNSYGSGNSAAVTLTVTDVKPAIQKNPANASAAIGKTVTFSVTAVGSGLKYQWQFSKDGGTTWYNWDGKTSASVSVTASSTNGGCLYRCVVKNSYGSVTSASAKLTVK